jgi:hypothetical protein
MHRTTSTRRSVLRLAVALPLAVGAAACGKGPTAGACVDPGQLSEADTTMRASLQYVDNAADPQQACGGCAYFKAAEGGCGACEILKGPVSATGHCTSWSPPAKA